MIGGVVGVDVLRDDSHVGHLLADHWVSAH